MSLYPPKQFLFLVLLSLLFTACHGHKHDQAEGMVDTTSFSTVIHLFNDSSLQALEIGVTAVVPRLELLPPEKRAIATRMLFADLFGNISSHLTTTQAIDEYVANMHLWLQEVTMSNNHTRVELGKQRMGPFVDMVKDEITLSNNNWLTYVIQKYNYTGGAHGMTIYTTRNINLETMESPLLSSLIDTDAYSQVGQLMAESMKQDTSYVDVPIYYDEIRPTENFYLTPEGIIWVFNPYDIAPYYVGSPRIKLSYDALNPYLIDPSFVETITE